MKLDEIYTSLFKEAAIGIAVVSLDRAFLRVNPFFCKMLGYSKEELLKMNVSDVTHPDDLKENIRLDDAILSKHLDHFTFEKRYVRKNGEIFWVLLTVTLLEENGEKVFLSQVQDISEHRELEKLRELQSLNAIITTYHHEIKNPLTIAVAVIDHLGRTRKVRDTDLDRLKDAFKRIRHILEKIEETAAKGELEYTSYSEESKMLVLKKASGE